MAIQQKLHTKLVQKLILTPSLQQAIKLLPMSTLELADLLNQEMVENPLLEEVPTEELQPAEQQQQQEKPPDQQPADKGDSWDDADYEYFFGDYLDDGYRSRTPSEVKELPPIENTLSTAASLGPPPLAALPPNRRRSAQGNRQRDHRQPRRRRVPGRLGRGDCRDGGVAGGRCRAGAAARADVRPDRRRRARSPGMPVAANPSSVARRNADREDRHRAPAAPAESPGPRNRPQAGNLARRPQGARRDHP